MGKLLPTLNNCRIDNMLLTSINRLHTSLSEYSTFCLGKNCYKIARQFELPFFTLLWSEVGRRACYDYNFNREIYHLEKYEHGHRHTNPSVAHVLKWENKREKRKRDTGKKNELCPGTGYRTGMETVCVCVTAWPDLKGSKRLLTRCSGLWLKLQHAAKWQENKLKMCEA